MFNVHAPENNVFQSPWVTSLTPFLFSHIPTVRPAARSGTAFNVWTFSVASGRVGKFLYFQQKDLANPHWGFGRISLSLAVENVLKLTFSFHRIWCQDFFVFAVHTKMPFIRPWSLSVESWMIRYNRHLSPFCDLAQRMHLLCDTDMKACTESWQSRVGSRVKAPRCAYRLQSWSLAVCRCATFLRHSFIWSSLCLIPPPFYSFKRPEVDDWAGGQWQIVGDDRCACNQSRERTWHCISSSEYFLITQIRMLIDTVSTQPINKIALGRSTCET